MMQHDGFDKKREMIKVLMDMLKHSASDEVSKGMPQPPTAKPSAMPAEPQMADGGMALASDEPENVMPSELPEAEGAEHEAPVMGEIEMEDEDNNSSAFQGFLRKKKN